MNRRDIVSRTGHLLEFREAENGPRGVRVATGDGKLTVDLDEAATKVLMHSDGSVTIEARNGVTVDAGTGTLTLSGQRITMSAKDGVKVDGGAGDVRLASAANVKVEGSAVSVNGKATAELTAGASATVRAGIVRIN